jgi:hypothetical protein
MPTEINILWFAITGGIIVTCILMLMMYTRKRLSVVYRAVEEAKRLVTSDRIDIVEKQIQMIFNLIERRLASLLHAPHLEEMDDLLRKLSTQEISVDEAKSLYTMLIERRDALTVEGVSRPDLDFPELFVLWSLEVRMARAGVDIPQHSLTTRFRPPPHTEHQGGYRAGGDGV